MGVKGSFQASDRPGRAAPLNSHQGLGAGVLIWKMGMKRGYLAELAPGISNPVRSTRLEVLAAHLRAGPRYVSYLWEALLPCALTLGLGNYRVARSLPSWATAYICHLGHVLEGTAVGSRNSHGAGNTISGWW